MILLTVPKISGIRSRPKFYEIMEDFLIIALCLIYHTKKWKKSHHNRPTNAKIFLCNCHVFFTFLKEKVNLSNLLFHKLPYKKYHSAIIDISKKKHTFLPITIHSAKK